jgi:hypothetical protein
MTYISKNAPRQFLVEECQRLKKELYYATKKNDSSKEKRSKIRVDWKARYDKLHYQLMKKDQLIYGKDIHIERLRARIIKVANANRRKGYANAMKKVKKNDFKIMGLAAFFFKVDTVLEIYSLDFSEYAFIMWAGRYDFFDRRDYDDTARDTRVSYYNMINRMKKRNIVDIVATKSGSNKKIFSLTGIGVGMYNKISKFTNNYLKDASPRT